MPPITQRHCKTSIPHSNLTIDSPSPRDKNKLDEIIEKLINIDKEKSTPQTAVLKEPLKNHELYFLCEKAQEIFLAEPPLLQIKPPVRLVGDVHGQFSDVLRFLGCVGFPPEANYIFIGDFVDRGPQSVELIALLFALKSRYPLNFFLLRGNHESCTITRQYGFLKECETNHNKKVWRRFIECFNVMPLTALVGGKIFCTHGGLSPHLNSFWQIQKIRRPAEVPEDGLLCDLLWSDPSDKAISWGKNARGTSYTFGQDVIEEQIARLGVDLVVRAHQYVEKGYEFHCHGRMMTIFTAPNYVLNSENYGAIMNVGEDLKCNLLLLEPRTVKN